MSKIDNIISEKKLKPHDCLYHTNRAVKGVTPESSGSIRVLATQDKVAHVEYKCPECLHEDFVEQEWKRPFSVKCRKCSFLIRVPKMKQQFKKEMKAGKAMEK